jgi:hypothetical protein
MDTCICPNEKCQAQAIKINEGKLWIEYICKKCGSKRVALKEGTPRVKEK